MPFTVPPLGDVITRTVSDFRTRLDLIEGAAASLRRSLSLIAGTVWAGAVYLTHGHLEWLAKQFFALTAEREALLRMAEPYRMSLIPATFAEGEASGTGVDTSVVPAGTILRRADGVRFSVVTDATVASGTVDLDLEAVTAGASGNTVSSTVLTFESPVSGVNSTVLVGSDGLVDGTDEEGIEAFRARFLLRLREPPEGGADHDYVAWALEVSGVTRVWVYRHENGLGTVVVRFVRDGDGSGSAILPDSGEVADVQAKLDAERPVTAEVTVEAPDGLSVAYTMSIDPDTSATRAAVTAALDELHETYAEAGDGDGRGTLLLSKIRAAISDAEGIDDYTLASPSANVVPALGELPIRGTVTFT